MSRCCELPTSLITKALFIQFSTSLYWIFCVSLCARLINFLFFCLSMGLDHLEIPITVYFTVCTCLLYYNLYVTLSRLEPTLRPL